MIRGEYYLSRRRLRQCQDGGNEIIKRLEKRDIVEPIIFTV
jgi:hypothetical protein